MRTVTFPWLSTRTIAVSNGPIAVSSTKQQSPTPTSLPASRGALLLGAELVVADEPQGHLQAFGVVARVVNDLAGEDYLHPAIARQFLAREHVAATYVRRVRTRRALIMSTIRSMTNAVCGWPAPR